ncbi:glycosyltransferase, partial [Oleiphilus sp. HI0061]
MKGKKVVIVANAAFTILNFRRELIETLVNRGSKVLVACPPSCSLMSGRDLEGEFSDLGVDFTPVDMMRNGTNPIKDIGYLRRLYSLFKAEEPDYVLNYTIKPAIYSSIAARMAGVSVICSNITGIGYAMTSSSVKGRLLSFVVSSLYRTALRFNKRVFFQNPDDREVFVNKGLLNKDDTVILNGSGINTESFKRHSDIPSNCSFIFVGRLLRDKGIFEYIAAAEKLK